MVCSNCWFNKKKWNERRAAEFLCHLAIAGFNVLSIKLVCRHTDGQKAHEMMLNITNYKRNANQN